MREVLQTELQQEQREKSSPNSKIPHTKRKTLLDMTLCAVCAALTCVLAPLSLPSYNPEVPISLATFAVKYAALSQVIYILLGFAGLPVFAGFTAGVGILARPSAGYMFGYIVLAWLESLIFHGFGGERRMALGQTVLLVLGMISGTVGCYVLGTVWFMVMMQTPLWTALVSCVIPFLFGDAVKIAVAAVIVPQIRRAFDSVMGKRKLA